MNLFAKQTIAFDKQQYHERVGKLYPTFLKKAQKILYSYLFFHLLFFLLGGLEIALFLSFFALLGKSAVLAFLLSLFLLTLFSFFVLRLYLQAKKPEQLFLLCEEYLQKCKEAIGYQEGIPEHHVALANGATKCARELYEKEYSLYSLPSWLATFAPLAEKCSAFFHWKELHFIKEHLFLEAIDEHIKAVKCEPTNLEIHAALANAYVTLSSLYADPRNYEGYDEERWIPQERLAATMEQRFRETAARAIEEFKILNDYAPEDPWVHLQLAYSYHDLHMPEEEIKEYETVLKLQPDDKETLFKLGILYFQKGKNAQGLRIYEILKQTHYSKAESLIKFYGDYSL